MTSKKYIYFRVVVIVFVCVFLFFWTYSKRGRTLILTEASSFPSGIGKSYRDRPARYMVTNKEKLNENYLVAEENLDQYSLDLYDRTYIPEHNELIYTVGYFQGWMDIADSEDKYLLLNEGDGQTYRYRFIVKDDRMISRSESAFAVQNTGIFSRNDKNIFNLFTRKTSGWSTEKLMRAFNKGDVIAIIPKMKNNISLDVDSENATIIKFVFLRRAFGFSELKLEMLFNL